MASNIIHVSSKARRILAARRRPTYDQMNVVEIILALLRQMARRLDNIAARVGASKDPSSSGQSDPSALSEFDRQNAGEGT
jgi:hypothetical protein